MRATKQIIVEEGQTIYDIALMHYGHTRAVALLIADNNLGFDAVLNRGQVLTVQNYPIPNPDDTLQGGRYQDALVQGEYAKIVQRINTGDLWQHEAAFDYSFDFGFEA